MPVSRHILTHVASIRLYCTLSSQLHPLSRWKDRTLSDSRRSHRPTMRSLDLLRRERGTNAPTPPSGAWLLITPIIEIVTIPLAFRPGCAPRVSRRLRYSMLGRAFQQFDQARQHAVDLGGSSPGSPADDRLRRWRAQALANPPRLHPFISNGNRLESHSYSRRLPALG